jgi:LmbE family N-acetylglucosaminyl deacetylase
MMFDRPHLTVACIAAHPDDEVLLAGGSLARHAAAGHSVHTLILAAGLDARGAGSMAARDALAAEARRAAECLGSEPPVLAGLPDNRLDSVPLLNVVKEIELFLSDLAVDVVYTHHRGDLNIDHRVTHDAVVTATRPLPGIRPMRILAGEVMSSSEWQSPQMPAFQPTVFHVLNDAALGVKIQALEIYADEIRAAPHPRSVEGVRALATLRGTACGHDAAEAFMIVRDVLP